jgi:hypothetical protein
MTRDEIMELSPQELNDLMVKHFGLVHYQDGTKIAYTKDHNAAFIAVDVMRDMGYTIEMDISPKGVNIMAYIGDEVENGKFGSLKMTTGKTVQIAICRCALLARSIEGE